MSKRFHGAAAAAQLLANAAQRAGRNDVRKTAITISHIARGLAGLDRGFEAQRRQLVGVISKLRRSIAAKPTRHRRQRGEPSGYYVNISGNRGLGRPADTGLVGRRIGRGPVRMASQETQSARVLSAAFAKLIAAQSQLQELRVELEQLKARRK